MVLQVSVRAPHQVQAGLATATRVIYGQVHSGAVVPIMPAPSTVPGIALPVPAVQVTARLLLPFCGSCAVLSGYTTPRRPFSYPQPGQFFEVYQIIL